MNWTELQKDWESMKVLIRAWWPQLADEDLNDVNADRDALARVLQERCGFPREEAEEQICAFEKEVRRPGAAK